MGQKWNLIRPLFTLWVLICSQMLNQRRQHLLSPRMCCPSAHTGESLGCTLSKWGTCCDRESSGAPEGDTLWLRKTEAGIPPTPVVTVTASISPDQPQSPRLYNGASVPPHRILRAAPRPPTRFISNAQHTRTHHILTNSLDAFTPLSAADRGSSNQGRSCVSQPRNTGVVSAQGCTRSLGLPFTRTRRADLNRLFLPSSTVKTPVSAPSHWPQHPVFSRLHHTPFAQQLWSSSQQR